MAKALEPLPLEEHPVFKSVAAFRDYYAVFLGRVWSETLHFFGWNWRTLLVPVLYFAGAIVAFVTLEGEVVRDEILTALAFGLIPVAGLTVLVALVNIIRVPWLLDSECKTASSSDLETVQSQLSIQRGIVEQYASQLTEANYERTKLQGEVSTLRQQLTIWEINSRNDRQDINKMIHSWNPTIDEYNFDGSTPWIQFDFYIFNGSMFAISVDDTAGGFITYGDRRLKGQLSRERQWRVDNLYRGWTARIKVRLWLEVADAAYLKTELRQPETNPKKYFGLRNLEIIVRGSTQSVVPEPGIAPKPLILNFGGVDKNQRSR